MSDHHTDLVARLRGECWQYDGYLHTAADLIESQAKEIERRDEETPLEVQAARDCEKWERARADKAEAEVTRLREALLRCAAVGGSQVHEIVERTSLDLTVSFCACQIEMGTFRLKGSHCPLCGGVIG